MHLTFLAVKLKTHEIRGGILITTGALKVRLANASTGETLDLNIPGPGMVIPGPNGSSTQIMVGPWLLGVPEGVLPDFSPRLFFSRGRVVATANDTGTFTSLTIQGGNVVDLCAALAD